MTASITTLELARMEIVGLTDLITQFQELLSENTGGDPAIERLTPVAYPDDAEAAREFRRLTEGDLLARRLSDAREVDTALAQFPDSDAEDPEALVEIMLTPVERGCWLRTLSAIRLVIATRLGIETEDRHDAEDPEYGAYDWLGYRIETIIEASDDAS